MLVGFPQAKLGIWFDSIICKNGVLFNKKFFKFSNVFKSHGVLQVFVFP
jgi:hypothetical protein